MLQISISRGFLYFMIYSFIGWFCETIFCWIGNKKLVNRGFLSGPYCPIYGFGGLIIITLAAPFSQYPPLVFLVTMLCCGVLEYFTGWLLETVFQTRWWDYSHYRLQIKGRVCLYNLLWFGIMGLGLLYLLHPVISDWLSGLDAFAEELITAILFVLLAADFICTVASITKLRDRLHRLQSVFSALEEYEEKYSWFDKKDTQGSILRLRQITLEDSDNKDAAEILDKIEKLLEGKEKGRRLLSAFPGARFKGLEEASLSIRAKFNEAKQKLGDRK